MIVCEFAVPTATAPKLTVEGIKEIWAWVPVPVSEIVTELEALFTTDRFPVARPVAFGVNCNVAVTL